MLAVKPTTTSVKSNFPSDNRQHPAISGAGKNVRVRKTRIPDWVKGSGSIRAVVSKGDKKTVETSGSSTSPLKQGKDVNGFFPSSSSSSKSGGIEVRAVVTIRKKMKEKIMEKMEDQWEFFINGIGQGILIQLISEEIDPG